MSRAEELNFQVSQQRLQEIARQRVLEATRPFLERYRNLMTDLVNQGLNDFVVDEFQSLKTLLQQMEALMESDPFAARDLSTSLSVRFHALPKLAYEQRRLRREAEIAAAEALREAREAEAERQAQLRSELETAWREGLSHWSNPVALNAALGELQGLREQLLEDQTNETTPAKILDSLKEVQSRYEASAERDFEARHAHIQRDAVTDVLVLQRQQLEDEAKKLGGALATNLQEALAQATGMTPLDQAEALNKLSKMQDQMMIAENQRKDAVRAIYQALQQAGFIVDKPERLTVDGQDEVLIRATRPSGAQADFRVNLRGNLSYKFHQYKGRTCERDMEPVMATLQDVYGISLSDRRVIWTNPDDRDHDARPYPDALQEIGK